MTTFIFITGISEGVGKSVAIKFAKLGYKVIGISRSKPDYLYNYPNIFWFYFDIGVDRNNFDSISFKSYINKYTDKFDLIIINAASACYGKLLSLSDNDILKIVNTNFLSSIKILKILIPMMKNSGQVIFVGSSAEYLPAPNMGIYASLKAAQSHLAMTLSVEYMHSNIQFKVVRPGVINTGFAAKSNVPYNELEQKIGILPEKVADDIIKLSKQKRFFLNSGRVSQLLYMLNKISISFIIWLSKKRHKDKVKIND